MNSKSTIRALRIARIAVILFPLIMFYVNKVTPETVAPGSTSMKGWVMLSIIIYLAPACLIGAVILSFVIHFKKKEQKKQSMVSADSAVDETTTGEAVKTQPEQLINSEVKKKKDKINRIFIIIYIVIAVVGLPALPELGRKMVNDYKEEYCVYDEARGGGCTISPAGKKDTWKQDIGSFLKFGGTYVVLAVLGGICAIAQVAMLKKAEKNDGQKMAVQTPKIDGQ